MSDCGRERDHVKDGAAAGNSHKRLPIQAGLVDPLKDREAVREVVLDRFTALHEHRLGDQLQRGVKRREVLLDLVKERRACAGHLVVDHNQDTVAPVRLERTDRLDEHRISAAPDAAREADRKPKRHREPVGGQGHAFSIARRRRGYPVATGALGCHHGTQSS